MKSNWIVFIVSCPCRAVRIATNRIDIMHNFLLNLNNQRFEQWTATKGEWGKQENTHTAPIRRSRVHCIVILNIRAKAINQIIFIRFDMGLEHFLYLQTRVFIDIPCEREDDICVAYVFAGSPSRYRRIEKNNKTINVAHLLMSCSCFMPRTVHAVATT